MACDEGERGPLPGYRAGIKEFKDGLGVQPQRSWGPLEFAQENDPLKPP